MSGEADDGGDPDSQLIDFSFLRVDRDKLLDAVERFKEIGGTSVTVSQPDYVFRSQSRAMERLTLGA